MTEIDQPLLKRSRKNLNWFNFVLLSLVCYRVTQFFSIDSIFHNLRIMAGCYDYNSQGKINTSLGRLLSCPYCLGVWIAMPLAIIGNGLKRYTLVYWLAIAGLQSFLQGLSE